MYPKTSPIRAAACSTRITHLQIMLDEDRSSHVTSSSAGEAKAARSVLLFKDSLTQGDFPRDTAPEPDSATAPASRELWARYGRAGAAA